jgi:flagellar hook-associated protein 1
MAKIQGLMDIGKRGMSVSQTALQTASHNITNKTTEGYSRQRVDTVTSHPTDEGRYRLGTGSRLGSITRTNNPWIEKQLEQEGSQFAFLEGQSQALSQLENVLNEQTVKGINDSIGNFFGSFRELANNPESALPRTQVREAAEGLIQTFQNTKRQLVGLESELNKNISSSVGEVNSYAKQIADLNIKINSIEISNNGPANDERDRRDLLVKKLSEKLDISYGEDPISGMINITAGQTGLLVTGTTASELKTFTNENDKTAIYSQLSIGGTQVDITDQFRKGAIGGSLDLRDGQLSSISNDLDQLIYGIAKSVNEAHQEGYDRYNQTGLNFFDLPVDGSFDLQNLSVNSQIRQDVGRIAAASKMDSPGDNTTANVIQQMQFNPLMQDGMFTFDNFYTSKVGEIGIAAQRASSALESQKNSLDQLKNVRESVSGVSLDEEAAKMIEYQKSYEASARMIKVADEMFDTILNLKRF